MKLVTHAAYRVCVAAGSQAVSGCSSVWRVRREHAPLLALLLQPHNTVTAMLYNNSISWCIFAISLPIHPSAGTNFWFSETFRQSQHQRCSWLHSFTTVVISTLNLLWGASRSLHYSTKLCSMTKSLNQIKQIFYTNFMSTEFFIKKLKFGTKPLIYIVRTIQ